MGTFLGVAHQTDGDKGSWVITNLPWHLNTELKSVDNTWEEREETSLEAALIPPEFTLFCHLFSSFEIKPENTQTETIEQMETKITRVISSRKEGQGCEGSAT